MEVGWLLLALVAVAAYLGYRKLQEIERDLRRELAEQAQQTVKPKPPPSPPPDTEPQPTRPSQAPLPETFPALSSALRVRILEQVKMHPGLIQTELYSLLGDVPRRRLQAELLEMAREGLLKRQPVQGSYRLDVP